MVKRVYLDWNASAPLRAEARDAVVHALETFGNPSSVHFSGRQVRGIIEKARRQVSDAIGAGAGDIVFTSGASEAAALGLAGRELLSSETEHDAVMAWTKPELPVDGSGRISVETPAQSCVQMANAETGVLQELPKGIALTDATQAFGKTAFSFDWLGCDMAIVSAHKTGGPRGIGALVLRQGVEVVARIKGGGQELGRRSGTENVTGIAGFGAAAEAAARDLANGVWQEVRQLRDMMEDAIMSAAPETQIFGASGSRLPNTSYFSTPGWKGETQVMTMDLAGFSISAGSACSSGKARVSRVLRTMGQPDHVAASAVRVSIGPDTDQDDVLRFVDAWSEARKRFFAKAA